MNYSTWLNGFTFEPAHYPYEFEPNTFHVMIGFGVGMAVSTVPISIITNQALAPIAIAAAGRFESSLSSFLS
jgi:hypothetical protein